jgi:hypothetical protein
MNVNADFEIKADPVRRTVFVRMRGIFDETTMKAWCKAYREQGTDAFRGKNHIVIADMRGMKTVHPSIAALMGAEIGHARRNGAVLCAHISDDTVQRLQAARVARQNSPGDDITIDVDSMDEAQRVAQSYAKFLDDPRYAHSLREAL